MNKLMKIERILHKKESETCIQRMAGLYTYQHFSKLFCPFNYQLTNVDFLIVFDIMYMIFLKLLWNVLDAMIISDVQSLEMWILWNFIIIISKIILQQWVYYNLSWSN